MCSIRLVKQQSCYANFQKVLPRPPLITAYKSFIRSYLDYGDIIYDQAYNVSFLQKIESIQCNAALATRGAIRETSREKLYHELGFESFVSKRSYRKLCSLYKVFKTQSPRYLFEVIPTAKRAYITRNNDKLPHFKVKHNYFKNYFFPSTVTKWNKLDLNIRTSESLSSFKSKVVKFIRPSENSIFLCNNPKGIQLLTRLRLGLIHLRDHKFNHNFLDTLNPICNCGEDIKTSCHYLFHCSLYTKERLALLNLFKALIIVFQNLLILILLKFSFMEENSQTF